MKKKGDMNIKSYFTVTPSSPLDAHGPQASRTLQPTLDDHWKKELRETACDYICRWWYDVDIPFNAYRSPYYELMFDAIHAAGKDFTGPTMHEIRGYRLQKEIASINEYLKNFKDSLERTGCIIMSNGWTDQRNNTIINFLIFCPQGTMFLKLVDASNKVKDGQLLFQLLDEVVEEVGVANVVQVITDNVSKYVLAAQWWQAFGSHCPELQKFAIHILIQTCSATGFERNWFVFERIHMKKKNRLNKKWLNDLVYVQYNLRRKRSQLLNKRLDSDPIVLEDIDPTSDWFAATAQAASATTSTIAVEDDDDEEPWADLSNSDVEVERDDLGSSSSSQ
eukprot:PITA_24053